MSTPDNTKLGCVGAVLAAMIGGYCSLVAAGKLPPPWRSEAEGARPAAIVEADRVQSQLPATPAPLPARPPVTPSEELRKQYEDRAKANRLEAYKRFVAKIPWCVRCQHYHEVLASGCPREAPIHYKCGTRHFPDETCPETGSHTPKPWEPK
jgi:hypothetical protein